MRSVAVNDDHGGGGGCISHDRTSFDPGKTPNAQLVTSTPRGADKAGGAIHRGAGLNARDKLITGDGDHLIIR